MQKGNIAIVQRDGLGRNMYRDTKVEIMDIVDNRAKVRFYCDDPNEDVTKAIKFFPRHFHVNVSQLQVDVAETMRKKQRERNESKSAV